NSLLAIQASKPVTRTPRYKCATRRTQRTASSPPSYTSQVKGTDRNAGRIKFKPSSESNNNCIHEPVFAGLVGLFVLPKDNMRKFWSEGSLHFRNGDGPKCTSLKCGSRPFRLERFKAIECSRSGRWCCFNEMRGRNGGRTFRNEL
ncbi:MAG: hypothetical protein ACTS46_01170, partial [Candidatus Hodgkinia cicadicola]